MKRGEIWLVNFDPSIGNEYQKMRPALIVQADIIKSSLFTVIPLSSKTLNKQTDDILVYKDSENRLLTDSLLKVTQISSFDSLRFVNFIGIISKKLIVNVDKYLKKHFDLE